MARTKLKFRLHRAVIVLFCLALLVALMQGASWFSQNHQRQRNPQLEELARRYLDRGMPVICWACINMREPIVGPQWKLLDTGELFTWISNEHCMLLVGYDEEGYYFNDPYDNNGLIRYPKETVEERHRAQHMQAVGVWKNGK